MAAWSDGYFTDVQYTGHHYPELAPGFMAFACLRQGVRPPALGPGAAYLELGCGQGFGLTLLAAANPGMQFWGADFHPGQIDNANRLARAAGLSNIAFEDWSFEQMLALPAGALPKFDVIALHGIYSWVSPENRAAVVQILDRMLKPGGMVYVSYNCLPTWSALMPVQRFVADHVARGSGSVESRILDAFRAAQKMMDDGAVFFRAIPALKQHLASALREKPAYLIHEYLNAHSHPFFHADVARELDAARLSFAASANIADDLVNLAAPEALRHQILEAQDPTLQQTLLDYAGNKPFRRDIFVRGRNALSATERSALLGQTRFSLLTTAKSASFDFFIPIGQMKGAPAVYQPIVEALAGGPKSFAELAALPAFAGAEAGLLQAVILLVGARQIHPLAPDGWEPAPAQALNRAICDRLAFDEAANYLAAPLVGAAVRVEFPELVAARAVLAGQKDPKAAAQGAWPGMARTGRRLLKNGEMLTDQAGNEAALAEHIAAFNSEKSQLFRMLGVV